MKAGWQEKSVGEILQLEYGKPLDASDRIAGGRYPVYGANGEIGRTDKFYYSKPSIIVGRKGSAGEINLSEEKFWPLDVTYFATFDEQRYDRRFVFYLLKTLELPKLAKGVKPGINRNEVYAQTTKAPPLHEQHRIVATLDAAFDGIATAKANAEKNLQNARALFESHLQSVFTERGDGWKTVPFGEIAAFRNGINFTKSSKGAPVKILGVKDFQNHYWAPFEGFDSIVPDGVVPDSDALIEGDIVFVRSNGNPDLVGRSLLIGNLPERTTHSGFTIKARLHSNEVMPTYLCHFLKSNGTRQEMIDGGNGANIKSLNQGTLFRIVVPFPSLDKQAEIVWRLDRMQAETQRLESLYRQKLAALDELKKSLLHRAFSGQL